MERIVANLVELAQEAKADGPAWGAESSQLDMTLLVWSPGEGIQAHVNNEVDVLVIALEGSATVSIEDEARRITAGEAILIPIGTTRSIVAHERFAHLNVHQRRKRLGAGSMDAFRNRSVPSS